MEYVAGLLFNPAVDSVTLVRKLQPEWQRGRLNAVGGKIEPGETPLEAMEREFEEEAGLSIHSWDRFAVLMGDWGRVHFFRAFALLTPRTMEAEPIEVYPVSAVPYAECLPNLSWLIPLGWYVHDRYATVMVVEDRG